MYVRLTFMMRKQEICPNDRFKSSKCKLVIELGSGSREEECMMLSVISSAHAAKALAMCTAEKR